MALTGGPRLFNMSFIASISVGGMVAAAPTTTARKKDKKKIIFHIEPS